VFVAALLSACGGGGGGGGGGGDGGGGTGTLKLAVTDAPACGYDSVFVTIDRVRVHPSASAADADAGWSELVLTPPRRVDLLSLNNGMIEELGQTSLPAGRYNQLRLVLAANSAGSPMANAVTPSGTGVQTALATPTTSQGGLRLNVAIDIAANQISDYVLDFDACKSVVRVGNTGNYNLKPVLGIIPRINEAGMRVVGFVASSLPPATTRISVQSGGAEVKSTPPDSTGRFTLYPVPAGTYDLVISAVGRVPAIVTGVVVSNTAHTNINTAATPITPPAQGTLRAIGGTVSTGTTPVDALIEIVKKYSGGPNVVIAGAPVDGSNGNFLYTVSSGAPIRAPYVPNMAPLVFTTDNATPSGRYTVNAIVGGVVKSLDVDVTTTDATNLSFTFP
jgi:hypothetical protein